MTSIMIELSEELTEQLDKAGLLYDSARLEQVIKTGLQQSKFIESPKSSYEIIDELCGKYADGSNLSEWYLAEKAKERALEDSKYDRRIG